MSEFRMASAYTVGGEPAACARAAAEDLTRRLGGPPHLVAVYATEHMAGPAFTAALREALPGAAIFGGTTCRGVLTERGYHTGPDGAAGLLGIHDPDGAYGVAAAPLDGDAAAAAEAALAQATLQAEREFEAPGLVLCSQPPGEEEAILEGLARVAGPHCPVLGGSSADEALAGAWRQFAGGQTLQDSVAAAALFPLARTGLAFQSGYAPSARSGRVTAAQGRVIHEIDGRPAAHVYAEWTDGAIDGRAPGVILSQASAAPLGRRVAEGGAYDEYILSHPAEVTPDGGLAVFTDIAVGDELVLMEGSDESLIGRGARVVQDAMEIGGLEPGAAAGAMVIFCGGCMMAVEDRVAEIGEGLAAALGGRPFLCAFTYGEQGALISRQNRHGNLMVAAAAFGGDDA